MAIGQHEQLRGMLTQLPVRTRALPGGDHIVVAQTGRFFRAGQAFIDRQTTGTPSSEDLGFLRANGYAYERQHDLAHLAHLHGLARRSLVTKDLDYLILVPTLRCNLACSYCQVSRASENSRSHDWTETTLRHVLALIDGMTATSVKIEFQGGEPTLRPDLIEAVIEASVAKFEQVSFVICTNLSRVDAVTLALFDRADVHISTSLDGALTQHQAARTITDAATATFADNLALILERYGPDKVSALPTLDPRNPPDIDALIDAFAGRGLTRIFLRPINYQGFARKRHDHSRSTDATWQAYYTRFVHTLIDRNWANRDQLLEETYLSLCLRRIFQPGHDRHVDLRNPNPAGVDYVVIDHDGAVYPTDEARMLTRSGVIDLRIGDVVTGWQTEARALLSAHGDNRDDPACRACAYQPYCGRDVVDDLSRYGRIDLPRHETEFCRRHLAMFDLAFELIYDPDPKVQYSVRRWLRVRGDAIALGPTS